MTFSTIASHDLPDGTEIAIGRDGGQHLFVFDGPGGLEVVIQFDHISIGREITFRVADSVFAPSYLESGSIEAGDWGEVTEWLEAFAEGVVVS